MRGPTAVVCFGLSIRDCILCRYHNAWILLCEISIIRHFVRLVQSTAQIRVYVTFGRHLRVLNVRNKQTDRQVNHEETWPGSKNNDTQSRKLVKRTVTKYASFALIPIRFTFYSTYCTGISMDRSATTTKSASADTEPS
jgi:hypothetical protein